MQRWTLFWTFAAVMTAITVWGLLAGAADEDTARLLVRWTIRASVVPFLLAFVAAAAGTLWPGRTAEWLLDNRKHLGLAFAYGVALNMAAIVWLGGFNRGVYWSGLSILDRVESYGGLAVVVALSLTSFDRLSRQIPQHLAAAPHARDVRAVVGVLQNELAVFAVGGAAQSAGRALALPDDHHAPDRLIVAAPVGNCRPTPQRSARCASSRTSLEPLERRGLSLGSDTEPLKSSPPRSPCSGRSYGRRCPTQPRTPTPPSRR